MYCVLDVQNEEYQKHDKIGSWLRCVSCTVSGGGSGSAWYWWHTGGKHVGYCLV